MKTLFLLLTLSACATSQAPQQETDLPFCTMDSECLIYRSRCGKFVAFNRKFAEFVEQGFKDREGGKRCEHPPDRRSYSTRCEMNTCVLIQR